MVIRRKIDICTIESNIIRKSIFITVYNIFPSLRLVFPTWFSFSDTKFAIPKPSTVGLSSQVNISGHTCVHQVGSISHVDTNNQNCKAL